MRRALALLAGLFLAVPAGARPAVEILAPAAGTCFSGDPPVADTVPGGLPPLLPADVPIRLRLSESAGAEVALTVTVDGAEVLSETWRPAAAGQAAEIDLAVPAAAVEDGLGRRIRVTAVSNGQESSDEVVVDIDRAPPAVVFDDATMERLGACVEGEPPPLGFAVEDALDPAPLVAQDEVVDGCARDRRVTARDRCGNAQRVTFRTLRPAPGPVAAAITGVDDGASVLAPTVDFEVDAPVACVQRVEATLTRGDDPPAPLVGGTVVEQPGDYVAEVRAFACGAPPAEDRVAFTVLPPPRADAGGPYRAAQGEPLTLSAAGSAVAPDLGRIVEYAWDLNADGFFDPEEGRDVEVPFDTLVDDGDYPIGLRITTDRGLVDFDFTVVTITDVTPTCDAGGPYEVQQGLPVTFDAGASRPGHPMEPILAYGWDFGDGRFPQRGAGLVRPNHRYEDEGEYTVTLTVEDIDSACEAEATVTVTDVQPVIANVRARDADRLVEGVPVVFTAGQTSAGSAAEPIVELRWDFGDGSPPVAGPDLRGPSHVYERGGTYTVCLEVRDVDSTVRHCFEIVVDDLRPIAHVDGPAYAVEGEEVVFDAGRSRPGGEADPLTRFVWDFGDGSPPVVVDDPARTRITHVFERDGRLTVTLTVADEDSEDTAEHAIFVDDASPRAAFELQGGGAPDALFEGVEVTLDAGGSAAGGPGDPIVEYAWDFGDGESAAGADAVAVAHAWPDDGRYLVRLVVRDADGSRATMERIVRVRNRPPSDVRIIAEGDLIESGRDATFRVAFTEAPGDLPRIEWVMGDGTAYQNRDRVTHRYPAPGRYEVRVTLDDGDGGIAEARLPIEVESAGPLVRAPATVDGVEGEPLAFTAEIEAAGDDRGGYDGPVAVDVPLAPPGAEWRVEDVDDGRRLRRLHFTWKPGHADAGERALLVVARSPSGVRRTAEVTLRIADAGTPMLAAAGGTFGAGRLTLYAWRYDALRRIDRLDEAARIPVGPDTGALAVTPDGRRVFVTVPSGGGVAVVETTGDAPRRVRRIPVGGKPLAAVYGADRLWVLDAGPGRLLAIDPDRLKLVAAAPLPDLEGLVDAAWVPAGAVEGQEAARLLAVSQVTGAIAVIDPAAAVAGDGPAVRAVVPLGQRLQRVVADPAGGVVYAVDGKARAVLRVPLADLIGAEGGAGAVPVEATPVPFAPRDLAVDGEAVWTAGEGGLGRIDAAGEHRRLRRDPLRAVTVLPPSLLGAPSLAIGAARRVDQLSTAELEPVLGKVGPGGHRLVHFVTRR